MLGIYRLRPGRRRNCAHAGEPGPESPHADQSDDRLAYVFIPPGKFTMGCSPGDSQCNDNEKPAHQVTISKAFQMGQTEVTREAFQRVIGGNASRFGYAGDGNRLPAVGVDWSEANTYCERIGGRLPTEAEWEYAARGGDPSPSYGVLTDVAWFEDNSNRTPHEVGQKRPNAFALYDMLGNVEEWVSDLWGPYSDGDSLDPKGPAGRGYHFVRGGSWASFKASASFRCCAGFETPGSYVGFRCVIQETQPVPSPRTSLTPPATPPAKKVQRR